MKSGYADDSPDDAAGAAFIIFAIGVVVVVGVLVASFVMLIRLTGIV
jgi:hypothetical protein